MNYDFDIIYKLSFLNQKNLKEQKKGTKMESQKLRYFCYVCEKQFETSYEAYSCSMCDSCAIEQRRQEQSKGQKFQVYQVRQTQNNNRTLGVLSSGIGPHNQPLNTVISITTTTISGQNLLAGFGQGSYLGNLLRQLMRQGNGMTAATQQQIQRLHKIQGVKQCSICQSNNQEEQIHQQFTLAKGFKLECNHTFHQQCIRPWFQRTNTCPVCRKPIN